MKRALLGMLCMFLAILSSCWDARELSDIGLVVMTGFDLDENGDERVTVLSVQPFSQAREQGSNTITWLGTASGSSAYEAMRNLRRISTRTLVWLHNKIIVIGEDKAKKNITNIADLITRNREFRYDLSIFVTAGRADEMLQIPASLEKSVLREFLGLIENTEEWSKGYALSMKDFTMDTMAFYEHGFVIGMMDFYDADRLTFSTDRQELLKMFWKDEKQSIAFVSGGGVVDEDRLIGWLSPEEMRGYLMLTNQTKQLVSPYENMVEDIYRVTAEISDMKTEISFPSASREKIRARVKVKASAVLSEVEGNIPDYDASFIAQMEKKFAQDVISDMVHVVKRAQNDLRTDFLEFHEHFSIQHPKEWKEIAGSWGEIFSRIPVDFEADIKIKRQGLLGRSYHSEVK